MQIICKHTLSAHPLPSEHIHSHTSLCTHGGVSHILAGSGESFSLSHKRVLNSVLFLGVATPPTQAQRTLVLREGPEAGAGLCSWVPPGQLAGSLRASLQGTACGQGSDSFCCRHSLMCVIHLKIQPLHRYRHTTPTDVSAFTRTHPVYPQIQSVLP